ncbi:MAG: hypothetical protein JSR34_03780 [Proteobacteria bacterium]|nr:hypothetical protein [Pseudomonadota bacterium]
MEIEAVYDDGRLEFKRSVTLKHRRFKVVVSVPDDEVIGSSGLESKTDELTLELSAPMRDKAQAELERYRALLDAPLPAEAASHMPQEYDDRLEAIAWRATLRHAQGRPE